jgi:Xaa-Pro aminopeptidase
MHDNTPMRIAFDLEARRPYLTLDFSDQEYDRRLSVVLEGMAQRGLDALILHSSGNFASARWLTNFQPVYGTCFVVIRSDGSLVVTTNGLLHGEPMHSMIWTCRVPDVRCSLGPVYGRPQEEVANLAVDALSGAKRTGFVGGGLMPRAFASAFERVPEIIACDDLITGARMLKSAEEIACMARAGEISDRAMSAAIARIAPGVTEAEIASIAVAEIHRLGAREAFPTCVVSGAQAGLKHSFPRMRPLVVGEMVFVDLGAEYRGYMSDTSRCMIVGEGPHDARNILSIAQDLYFAGIEAFGPGRTNHDISRALKRVVSGTKFEKDYFGSGYGHAIGMDLLEAPGGLFDGAEIEFVPGMALAYEPMVIVQGLGTGVIEDTLVITDEGYRTLTGHLPRIAPSSTA